VRVMSGLFVGIGFEVVVFDVWVLAWFEYFDAVRR